jgi:hypothetical protein
MARRRGKAKTRRKTQKKINLIATTEAVVLANVVCEGLFNCNAWEFVSGRTTPKGMKTGYHPSNLDSVLTLPELLSFDQNLSAFSSASPKPAPNYRAFDSVGAMEKIKANLQMNGFMMAAQLVLIPVGFTAITKVTRKPRASANKLLAYTGIGVKV